MTLTYGSLFTGFGGMDLGLDRAGLVCKWQVEINEYAQRVLAKHWAQVLRHGDVRTFPPGPGPNWSVDLICGGFPCQDISNSGPKTGLDGERSGLWFEFLRIIRELRPKFALVENVGALAIRGLHRILGGLAALGFDAEWEVLPACAFGADHIRERLFILAYPNGFGRTELLRGFAPACHEAYTRRERQFDPLDTYRRRLEAMEQRFSEPSLCRTNDGISRAVERLTGLGNAVYPDVAEWIGRRILKCSHAQSAPDEPSGTP